jgi:cytochrome P450
METAGRKLMSTASQEHAAAFDAEQFARGFHLYNDELQDDPYPVIDRLRAECPVAHSDLMGGFWVLTRYQDCRFALQNPDLFSSVQNTAWSTTAGRRPLTSRSAGRRSRPATW